MRNFYFFAVALVALLFASCSQVCELDNPLTGSGVRFAASVGNYNTRTTDRIDGVNWGGADKIGVFASFEETLTRLSIFEGAINNVFTNQNLASGPNALFTATPGSGNEILFPGDNSRIDFFAYRPWQNSADISETFTFPINVTNQADDLDFMWARSYGTNDSHPSSIKDLHFNRSMSMVRFFIDVEGELNLSDLNNLVVSIDGLSTAGTFHIANGNVTALPTVGNITMVRNDALATATTIVYDAILIPGQNFNASTITFMAGSQVWTWSYTPSLNMVAGNRYRFPVTLSSVPRFAFTPGATIEDWWEITKPPVTVHPPGAPPPTFEVDVTALPAFAATGGIETFTLTAEEGISWTIDDTSNPWLAGAAISPRSGISDGTDQVITVTLGANNGAMRTAKIIISCDDDSAPDIEIEVTQRGELLFAGADFNDLSAFEGLRATDPAARFEANGGMNGLGELRFVRDGTGNQVVFTAMIPDGALTGQSYISFFINGTSGNRTISVTLARDQGTPPITDAGIIVHAFNFNTSTTVIGTTSPVIGVHNGNSPLYGTGASTAINTGSNWTEVRVPLAGLDFAGVNRFQIRAGGATGALHNWAIDNITIIP